MKTLSGKKTETDGAWAPLKRSKATKKFLNKLDARRAKGRIAKKSRKGNRKKSRKGNR